MKREIYKIDHVQNFKEMMNLIADKFGDDIAFEYFRDGTKVSVTYARFKRDVFALGSYFYSLGLKDSKIAVCGENSYEWIVTYLASAVGGNTIVPLDKELKPAEANVLLEASGAEMLVYSAKKASLAEIAGEQVKHKLSMTDFPSAIETGTPLVETCGILENEIDVEKVCTIIYTSGTTGNVRWPYILL